MIDSAWSLAILQKGIMHGRWASVCRVFFWSERREDDRLVRTLRAHESLKQADSPKYSPHKLLSPRKNQNHKRQTTTLMNCELTKQTQNTATTQKSKSMHMSTRDLQRYLK